MNIYIPNRNVGLVYRFFPQDLWRVEADAAYVVTNALPSSRNHILLYTRQGCGTVCTDESAYTLQPGTLLLITREKLLSYRTHTEPWYFDWVEFMTDAPLPPLALAESTQEEPALLEQLCQALLQAQPQSASAYLCLLCRRWLCRETQGSESDVLFAVKQYIDSRPLSWQMSVAELACAFFLSERTLRDRFKKEFGQSPKEYILCKKMQAAQNLLLSTTLSIQQIAEMLGYSSVYYFSKAFRLYAGVSPKAFRTAQPL